MNEPATDTNVHRLALADAEFDLVPLVRMATANGQPLDAVRFVPDTTLAYPANEVEDADAVAGGTRLRTRLIGLLAAMGPMPLPYTELASAQAQVGEHAFLDLLEMIHHAQAKQLVRAHLASRFWLQHGLRLSSRESNAAAVSGEQAFTRVLCALVGTLGCAGDVPRGLPLQFVVYYAGLLRRRPMPAASLTALLRDYFAVPVAMQQFTGGCFELPAEAYARLGADDVCLGTTALLGDRVFDPSAELTLRIGPVRLAMFLDLLPGGTGAATLAAVVAFALGPTQKFSYAVELAAEDVPPAALASAACADSQAPQRLGLALWLRNEDTACAFTSGPFRVAPGCTATGGSDQCGPDVAEDLR